MSKPKRGSFESKQYSFIRSALRRASMRWPPKNEALVAARISRGMYHCNICKGAFQKKNVILDHIEPVVPVSGFTNWHDFALRLFCGKEGFQVICQTCSDIKTSIENKLRNNE